MGLERRRRYKQDEEEVVVSEKVFFGIIVAVILAFIGVALNPIFGAYGVIIGAFFTWVMASYLYAIYGVSMLESIKLRSILFLPTSAYIALVLFLFANNSIIKALAQIIGSVASTIIFYLILSIIIEYYKARRAV